MLASPRIYFVLRRYSGGGALRRGVLLRGSVHAILKLRSVQADLATHRAHTL